MNSSQLALKINELLKIEKYEHETTGIQVETSDKEVKKLGVSVDSGTSIIAKAAELKCDALLVHHGLFWGTTRIEGVVAKRIHALFKNEISLLAYHLPLDGDLSFGNAACIAKGIKLEEVTGFSKSHEGYIGIRGTFASAVSIEEVVERFQKLEPRSQPLSLAFGKKEIKSVVIITGGAANYMFEAQASGADLFISGEPKQNIYHDAKDLGMNCLFVGHYFSETFGVRALGEYIEKSFGVEVLFIDEAMAI